MPVFSRTVGGIVHLSVILIDCIMGIFGFWSSSLSQSCPVQSKAFKRTSVVPKGPFCKNSGEAGWKFP